MRSPIQRFVRFELLTGYMQQPAPTITEITFLPAFADASNFARAFKRWCGAPPGPIRSKT